MLGYASSAYAIIIYLIVVLVLIAVVVISLMAKDRKGDSAKQIVIGSASNLKVEEQSESTKPNEEEDKEMPSEDGISRFSRLSQIDAERAKYVRSGYDDKVTLKGICEGLRNYAAGNLKLYYSIDDIRRFIAGLLVSPIMILQGM